MVDHSLIAIKLIIIRVLHKKFTKYLHKSFRWYIIIIFYTMLNCTPQFIQLFLNGLKIISYTQYNIMLYLSV